MRFSLRRAAPEDAAAIADIHVRARRECMPYLPDIHSPEEVLQWIREVMPQHDEVWVAEDDGRVVGPAPALRDLARRLVLEQGVQADRPADGPSRLGVGVVIQDLGGTTGGCRVVPAGARHPRACWWHVTGCRVPAGADRRRRLPTNF
jgi:hypothetical protein